MQLAGASNQCPGRLQVEMVLKSAFLEIERQQLRRVPPRDHEAALANAGRGCAGANLEKYLYRVFTNTCKVSIVVKKALEPVQPTRSRLFTLEKELVLAVRQGTPDHIGAEARKVSAMKHHQRK